MKPSEPGLQPLNDAEAARRALKLLAERKVVPTPDTFAEAFWESAGLEPRGSGLAGVLKDVGTDLMRQSRMTQQEAAQMMQAAQRHHWDATRELIDRALQRRPGGAADAWPSMVLAILKQIDALHSNWTRARKLDSIAHVVDTAGADPAVALERLRRLVDSWGPALAALPTSGAPVITTPSQPAAESPVAPREEPIGVPPLVRPGADPVLAQAAERARSWQRLALRSLRALQQVCSQDDPVRVKLQAYLAQSEANLEEGPPDALSDWMLAIEREIYEEQRVRDGLQRLLGLLCDNLGHLAPDEIWLANQLEPVRSLLAGPVRSGQIAAAERRLGTLIAQQTEARRGLQEAKVALAEMLAMLLDHVGEMGSSTDRFNERVEHYQQQLRQSPDLATLSGIVHGLLDDTRTVREQIESSRAELAEARQRVEVYEARVSQLEHQLSEVSTLVQKDPLTNALNRRGLEQAFRMESARSLRYGAPLTLAMMDLDNFKRINDALGHVAGDRALVHFVTTVQATLRPTDLTGRSGGEEFAVLFPACAAQDGVEAVERLQRELARRPFQFEQQRLVLAFSAGVAQWRSGESLEQLMRRADGSLYKAKKAGKNRVIRAP